MPQPNIKANGHRALPKSFQSQGNIITSKIVKKFPDALPRISYKTNLRRSILAVYKRRAFLFDYTVFKVVTYINFCYKLLTIQ